MTTGRFRAMATALVASAALALATAAPALAATSLTVTVTGGGTFSASAPKTVFTASSISFTCATAGSEPASTESVTVNNGTSKGDAPLMVGTVTGLAFNNCTGPLGTVQINPAGEPYPFNVDSTTDGAGDTDVTVSKADLQFSMTGCTFAATGGTFGSYSNHTHGMHVGHKPPKPKKPVKLTISKVSGCAGLISNGEQITEASTYQFKPATLNISSTSP